MKKNGKKVLVTATLVSAAMTMGGCRFLPWANENAGVYGPPPEFSVEENVNAGVYGPPPTPTVVPEEADVLESEEE